MGELKMTFDDVRETFKRAVGILVDENQRIKDRLMIAYASQLTLIRPASDLSGEFVEEFQRLRYALSDAEMPYGYGERAYQKLRDMTEDEASELARTIFSMFLKLHDLELASVP
jgi:hypothetical protein